MFAFPCDRLTDTVSAPPEVWFSASPLVGASPRGGRRPRAEATSPQGTDASGIAAQRREEPNKAACAGKPDADLAAAFAASQASLPVSPSPHGGLQALCTSPLLPATSPVSSIYLQSPLVSLPPPAGAAAAAALALGAFPVIAQSTVDGVLLFPAYAPPPWVQVFELGRWRFGDADDRQGWTTKNMRFVLENRLYPFPAGDEPGTRTSGTAGKAKEALQLGPGATDAAADATPAVRPSGVHGEQLPSGASGENVEPSSPARDSTAAGSARPVVVVEYGASPPSAASLEAAVAGLLEYFHGDKSGISGLLGGERERRHSFSVSPRHTAAHAGVGASPVVSGLFALGSPLMRRRSSSNISVVLSDQRGEGGASVGASAPPAFLCPSAEVVHGALKLAIRFGVPDGLKKTVWLVANNAWEFLKGHEHLYKNALQQTFGDRVPATLKGKCPTFSAGVLGLQEDISGKQTRLKDFEFETDTPLAAWRARMGPSEAEAPTGRGEFFADITESTADLLKSWFAPTPRTGPTGREGGADGPSGDGSAGYHFATAPATPRWLSLLKGRRQKVGSNPLGQTIRDDLNFWPAPPSPSAEQSLRGSGSADGAGDSGAALAGDSGAALARDSGVAGETSRGTAAGVALLHGLGSFKSSEMYGERERGLATETRDRGRDLQKIDEDRAPMHVSASPGGPRGRSAGCEGNTDGTATGVEVGEPEAEDSARMAHQRSPAWHGRTEADVEALQQARQRGRDFLVARSKLFLDYMKTRPEPANGDDSFDVEKQSSLAKELFGRRDSTEVQDFRRYMRETHHRHMRHAERMRRARERSRERLTSSFALSSVSNYLAATGDAPGPAPRRFNTASSLDSADSFALRSPAGASWTLDGGMSQDSMALNGMRAAYSDYNLLTAHAAARQQQAAAVAAAHRQPSPEKTGRAGSKKRTKLKLPWMAAAWPEGVNKGRAGEREDEARLAETPRTALESGHFDGPGGVDGGLGEPAKSAWGAGMHTPEREKRTLFGRKKKDCGRGKYPVSAAEPAGSAQGDGGPGEGPTLCRAASSPTSAPLGFDPLVSVAKEAPPAASLPSRLPWRRSGTGSVEGYGATGSGGKPISGGSGPLGGKKRDARGGASKSGDLRGAGGKSAAWLEVRQPLGSAPASQEEGKEVDAAMVAKDKVCLPAPGAVDRQEAHPAAPGGVSAGSADRDGMSRWALQLSSGETEASKAGAPMSPQGKRDPFAWSEKDERDRLAAGTALAADLRASAYASSAFLDAHRADETPGKKKKNFGFFRRLFFHPNPFGYASRRVTTDEAAPEGDREPAGARRGTPSLAGAPNSSFAAEAWPRRVSEAEEEGEASRGEGPEADTPSQLSLDAGDASARARKPAQSRPGNGILASCACCCAANADAGRPVGPPLSAQLVAREGPSEILSRGFSRVIQKSGERSGSETTAWQGSLQGASREHGEKRGDGPDEAAFELPPSACFCPGADGRHGVEGARLSASSTHSTRLCPSASVSSLALLGRAPLHGQPCREGWASSPASPTAFRRPAEAARSPSRWGESAAEPGRLKSKEKPEKRHRLLMGLRRHKKTGAKTEGLPQQLPADADGQVSAFSTDPWAALGEAPAAEASQQTHRLLPLSPLLSACGPLTHPPSPSFHSGLAGALVPTSPLWRAMHLPGAGAGAPDHGAEYRRQLKKADVYEVEDVTDFHLLLTEKGKEKARRLLWCLNALHGAVEFCPVLPPLTCVLLLYFDEDVAYVILHCLLKKAVQRERSSNDSPFMPVKRKDFVRFVKLITATIAQRLPRLYTHLRSLTIDVAAWVARGVQDGFARMLPFDFVLRIYGAFLFEGANVFFRHCVALLKLLEPSLLNCTDHEAAEDVLYNCGDDPAVTLHGLSKTAFRYKLRVEVPFHKQTAEFPTPYLMTTRMRQFHRPRLRDESRILQPQHWEAIWGWVPETARILVPTLEYSSDSHGMSITAMLQRLTPFLRSPMLLVISTREGGILGCFSPFPFRYDAKAAASDAPLDISFVYQLQPEEQAYWWTGANQIFMNVTHKHIIIGGNDIAIFIDEDLRKGQSRKSASFDSAKLVKDEMGDFLISLLEIWILREE
ncbi:putative TLD domain-containing protein [Neospora caninum Liverpool]|uniref:Putative TLD domain-containing protein n=1 Tax=Neospora caninum (strain Liverpool) TaxID=572307 RepID=F0VKT6_NEOCL|nr:putative TLD domain-containing protein [Neospora caninum Liverpool]CBZ54687.1 putative TLD domain-containing protein [Neospora caninum Liverpool]|eukprot:XP_003884717.1 putative TLD domain-containing protein [Neospora caninum Liverpool]